MANDSDARKIAAIAADLDERFGPPLTPDDLANMRVALELRGHSEDEILESLKSAYLSDEIDADQYEETVARVMAVADRQASA